MKQLIYKITNMGMEQYMNDSRQELAIADEIYLNDITDEKELERRYENLDLTTHQKILINDYIACVKSADSRYSDISYMAGIKDAVKMFDYLELLNASAYAETKNKGQS